MILLDTHALVWWLADETRLSSPARRAIQQAIGAGRVHASTISVLEIATAVRRGRLQLARPWEQWLADARALPELVFEPVTVDIATLAGGFGDALHGDPADRVIVATAMLRGFPLVTADDKLRASPLVRTLW